MKTNVLTRQDFHQLQVGQLLRLPGRDPADKQYHYWIIWERLVLDHPPRTQYLLVGQERTFRQRGNDATWRGAIWLDINERYGVYRIA